MTWGLLILIVLIGLIPAQIASRKGGSFVAWWVFGSLLWIVALPAALMKRDDRYGECPWCHEPVRWEASVCPHCHRELEPLDATG